jgi:hypothetical protein
MEEQLEGGLEADDLCGTLREFSLMRFASAACRLMQLTCDTKYNASLPPKTRAPTWLCRNLRERVARASDRGKKACELRLRKL